MVKYLIGAFTISALVGITALSLYREAPANATSHNENGIEPVPPTQNGNLKQPTTPQDENSEVIEETIGPHKLTLRQITEINEWYVMQGYRQQITSRGTIEVGPNNPNSQAPKTSYQYYDIETLESLASSDRFARLELGRRLVRKQRDDKALVFLRESAVDGFGIALKEIGYIYRKKGRKLIKADAPNADKNLIEAYAWDYVFQLRFFPDHEPQFDSRTLDLEESRLHEITILAIQRGAELYAKLQQERLYRGLPEFDNYISESVKGLFPTRKRS